MSKILFLKFCVLTIIITSVIWMLFKIEYIYLRHYLVKQAQIVSEMEESSLNTIEILTKDGYNTLKSNKKGYSSVVYEATVTEAINQPQTVQKAIIAVFYNRLNKGMNLGSQGYDRSDRNKFINQQPDNLKNRIKHLVETYNKTWTDPTGGATHFAYKMNPWWSKDLELTYQIGYWKFWK